MLALVMVLLVCGHGAEVRAEESESVVGIWKLVEMNGEDTVISKKDLQGYEEMGVAMYMKIRENGTLKFSLFGEEMEGTWNEYGMVMEDSWLNYDLDGNKLTVNNADGGEMIFRRSSMDDINAILGYKDGVLDKDVSYSDHDKKILDTDSASVIITGYKADKTGFTVYMRCKNKTKHAIVISQDQCVLNKYIFHPEWSMSLERRETLDSEMTISPAELERAGLSRIDEMILEMKVVNADTEKVLQSGILTTVYPTGKKAAEIKAPVRKAMENETPVLKNKATAYIIQDMDLEDVDGLAINCYLENRSARKLTFEWTDVRINDQPVAPHYSETVLPGAIGYSKVLFLNTALQEAGIMTGDIISIQGKVKVYDKTKATPELIVENAFVYTP